jgi:hypothetical protein
MFARQSEEDLICNRDTNESRYMKCINGCMNRIRRPFLIHIFFFDLYSTKISLLPYFMVRRRADLPVPAMEEGIEEVLICHRKTRRGVRTTEKSIPVLISVKDRPGQNPQSKKGQNGISDSNLVDGSEAIMPTIDDATFHQCADEHAYDHPDIDINRDQPQTNVCQSWYP